MAEDLTAIADYVSGLAERLSPSQRRRMAMRIAVDLRKSNAARIGKNVDPDGAAFEPRKQEAAHGGKRNLRGKSGRVRRKAAMFQRLRTARFLGRKATPEEAQIGFFKGATARIASVHQRGLEDRVSHDRNAKRVRYARRRLLGFSADDQERIMERALSQLEG